MNDEDELLWRLYNENRTHARHHETLRSSITAHLLVLTGALVTLITYNRTTIGYAQLPLAVCVAGVGVFGLFFVRKQYERYCFHRDRAREYLKALNERVPGAQIEKLKNKGDSHHKLEFPRWKNSSLNSLWSLLYCGIAALGVLISIYCSLSTTSASVAPAPGANTAAPSATVSGKGTVAAAALPVAATVGIAPATAQPLAADVPRSVTPAPAPATVGAGPAPEQKPASADWATWVGALITPVTLIGGIVAWLQWNDAKRWKRKEYAAAQIEKLRIVRSLSYCCIFLDWSARRLAVPEEYRNAFAVQESSFVHTTSRMAHALNPKEDEKAIENGEPDCGLKFEWYEVLYRNYFDEFFDYLGEIDKSLRQNLITTESVDDVAYWVKKVYSRDNYPIFANFLNRYHADKHNYLREQFFPESLK